MAVLSGCPGVDVLERLLLGQVTVDETDALEAHVLDCPRCAQALQQLTAVDPLVEAVRAAQTHQAPQTSEAAEALIPWLKRLRPKDATQTMSLADPGAPTAVPATPLVTFDFMAPAEQPDELGRLGNYRILESIGAGGMGMVFLAEDMRLKRRVALKLIKPELLRRQDLHERFLTEARAIAAVEHDNIVSIYEAGDFARVPYLVMPLLLGESLEDYLRNKEGPVAVDDLLPISREIAAGLAAAHACGLVHRDIKPSNLWLEEKFAHARGNAHAENAHAENAAGMVSLRPGLRRVKILDFGLARSVEGEPLEREGAILGTPAYMSPEQGRGLASDARSDLFSLGCVMYRMATGRVPFQGKDVVTTLLSIATETPVPPQRLNPKLPADLAALIEKLLSKKPGDRYASAEQVVEAIRAIETRRRPRALGRWLVLTGACVALAILGTFAWFSHVHRPSPPVEITFEYDEPAALLVLQHEDGSEQEIDVKQTAQHRLPPGTYLVRPQKADEKRTLWPSSFVVHPQEPMVVPLRLVGLIRTYSGHSQAITAVAFLPQQDTLLALTASRDHDLRLWDLRQEDAGIRLVGHASPVHCVALSADGRLAVTGSGKPSPRGPDTLVRVWDLDTRTCIAELPGHDSSVTAVAFDPQGQIFLSGDMGGVVIFWDAKKLKRIQAIQAHDRSVVHGLTFLPDGKQALSCGGDHKLLLWDADKRRVVKTLEGHTGSVTGVSAAPDGVHVVTSSVDGTICAWNLQDVQDGNRRILKGHDKDVACVAYAPDGHRLLSGGRDATVRLWDARTGHLIHTFLGHKNTVHGVAFSRDGRRAVSGGSDRTLCLWELPK